MFIQLNEATRTDLVSRSKRAEREKDGKTRYEKRLKSKVSTSTAQYNKIDMNKLFKEGILTVGIDVKGETNSYVVTITFGGFLDRIRDMLKRNNGKLDLSVIVRSLVNAFNSDDVYIGCSCPDMKFRLQYFNTKNKINSTPPQMIPSNITNPHDRLGPGCKHVMMVLSNTSWIMRVASVIKNYITYMERNRENQYAKIIYPAIYGKEYEKPVQVGMFDNKDELETEKQTLDATNRYARTRTQFQKDNPYRIRPTNRQSQGQVSIEDEIEEKEE